MFLRYDLALVRKSCLLLYHAAAPIKLCVLTYLLKRTVTAHPYQCAKIKLKLENVFIKAIVNLFSYI